MKDIAIVLAEGFFDTPNGKGAHGLVRGSDRFEVESVIDSALAGRDAGEVLDGTHRDIPIHASIEAALTAATKPVTYAVVGIATHGGRFTMPLKTLMLKAIKAGLHLVNGLHDAASDDKELSQAATIAGVKIIDLRKPKPKQELHFWSGEIVNIKTHPINSDEYIDKCSDYEIVQPYLALTCDGKDCTRSINDHAGVGIYYVDNNQ